ncbi:MAG: hypothetical protein HUJ53_07175 [Holdemanella sp.]|nr:hypothetical protein [Holdemanella sp.]
MNNTLKIVKTLTALLVVIASISIFAFQSFTIGSVAGLLVLALLYGIAVRKYEENMAIIAH